MDVDKLSLKCGSRHTWIREILAECIGTCVLVFLGNCSVAQMVLSKHESGSVTSVNLAYGLAVTTGILVAGGGSGAHLNPAVTLALATVGKCQWRRVPHYLVGQYLGAFVSAPLTYFVYSDAIYAFDEGNRRITGIFGTAGIFTTYPADHLSIGGAFLDQVLGTFILMLSVSAITDTRNMQLHKNMYPIHVGIIVIVIGIALGFNCGYPINPARDLGPRIFVTIAGWGIEAFTYKNYWWIPIVGPHIGAIIGALVYILMVEMHWPKSDIGDAETPQDVGNAPSNRVAGRQEKT